MRAPRHGLVMAFVMAACTSASPVVAAEHLCPVMREWVKDVGDSFNAMARDATHIADPEARRNRYRAGLVEMRRLVEDLVDEVEALGPTVPSRIAEDIEAGSQLAMNELDDLDRLLEETPEVDDGRPQVRISQMIVRVEKVVDLPKPEMASYGDPELLTAFRGVAACQHGVKDVDDGVARDF